MKRFPRFLFAMAIFVLLFSACAVVSRNALIGKWNSQAQDLTLEFTIDGRLKQTTQGVSQELKYRFLADNSIELLVPGASSDPQPIAFTIADDKLTLNLGQDTTTGQAQTLDLTRVK